VRPGHGYDDLIVYHLDEEIWVSHGLRLPNEAKVTPDECDEPLPPPGRLGAARHPRERLGGDENSAMIIERAFSVVSATRNILNQFAIRLKNSAICTGKMHAVGMISQCLVAHPARHSATVLVRHQEPNAVLF
jgi:hypothetical protein